MVIGFFLKNPITTLWIWTTWRKEKRMKFTCYQDGSGRMPSPEEVRQLVTVFAGDDGWTTVESACQADCEAIALKLSAYYGVTTLCKS